MGRTQSLWNWTVSSMPFMTKYLLNRMIRATEIFSESITERSIGCGISGENHLETLIYIKRKYLTVFPNGKKICAVDSCVLLSHWDHLLILDS